MKEDRRQFPRKALSSQVCAYVDGHRYDAHSADISAGGMFLATDEPMVVGHLVALVFKEQVTEVCGAGGKPVFLVGRAVRRQTGAVKGVGLRWERAVTDGTPEQLRAFLQELLEIDAENIVQVPTGPEQRVRAVYRFDDLYAIMLKFRTSEASDPALSEGASDDKTGSAPLLEAPTLPRDSSPAGASSTHHGPVTSRIEHAASMEPCELNAVLSIDEATLAVRVLLLGIQGMFVQTPVRPVAREPSVVVAVDIQTRGSISKVACRCHVVGTDDGNRSKTPGLYLQILQYHDEEGKELLRQYVRWLHFHSVSSS